MVATRSKVRIGDRIAVYGTIRILTPEDDGRTLMTVSFAGAPAPITLDASWSYRSDDDLEVDGSVRLEGRLTRINHATDPRWTTGTMKIDGYAYPITLPIADIDKA
jgi:hypothetical protein